jgi:hypothetical protein
VVLNRVFCMSLFINSWTVYRSFEVKFLHLLFAILLFFSPSVFAGNTTGKIHTVWVHYYNDFVLFSLESTQPSLAACAVTGRYVVSTSTQQGKNILSTVLAAKAAGQTVSVMGKNTCTTHGDAEDVFAISIN